MVRRRITAIYSDKKNQIRVYLLFKNVSVAEYVYFLWHVLCKINELFYG